jgi:DNA-binding PadR family transcriptional regulator
MTSRKSQTQVAVLGALAVEDASGYGVRKSITETLGHFWHESFGQIYPTLASLEADGLVGRTPAGQFTITTAGLGRLAELLAEPAEPTRPRNGLLLRLFFASHLPQGTARQLVEDARDQARAALAQYGAIEAELAAESHPDAVYWLATVRYGVHHAHATLDWAEETLARLP